jgi:hypothetical protein
LGGLAQESKSSGNDPKLARTQAPDFSRGVSERLNVERIQGMFGVESYKPARASRLHMWSGCPKARIRLPTEIGGAGSSKRLCREYGGSLRRVRCQANGLAYASTMGWMQVEPQQRNAHPSEEDRSGSMNLPTFSRGESQSVLLAKACLAGA